jgi:signal transduction histidine kinase
LGETGSGIVGVVARFPFPVSRFPAVMTGRIPLQRALLGTVAIAILLGVIPAGIALDRRVASELMTRAQSDLEMAAGMIPARGMPRTIDALGRLTRSDVTVLLGPRHALVESTLDSATATDVRRAIGDPLPSARSKAIDVAGHMFLAVSAPLGGDTIVVLTRDRAAVLAVISELHRVAFISFAIALAVALALGTLLATRIVRPVHQLSAAARAMAEGLFDAPLPVSRIDEVALVAEQFGEMRAALDRRMSELKDANDALADRNARLGALQADLMQRDRLAASARLVGQLAHEIRNPVANLRNLLELIRRRSADKPDVTEFADLAIDELLRMHELAEQMLDLNRPRDPSAKACAPTLVAREVARLAVAGAPDGALMVDVRGPDDAFAAIAPDALKQVFVNLVQNAREAVMQRDESHRAEIYIDVREAGESILIGVADNGPGIPEAERSRIFDPFYSTKSEMAGVGLGLFVAEGLIRSAGGRLMVRDAPSGGALFEIELRRAHGDDIKQGPITRAATLPS